MHCYYFYGHGPEWPCVWVKPGLGKLLTAIEAPMGQPPLGVFVHCRLGYVFDPLCWLCVLLFVL